MIKRLFNEFFSLPSNVRNGTYILLILILLAILAPLLYRTFFVKKAQPFTAAEISRFDSIFNAMSEPVSLPKNVKLNPFDPNVYAEKEWVAIGLAPNIAKRIVNYISKGGRFYKADDLLKIYGFDTLFYSNIKEYVSIAKIINTELKHTFKPKKNSNTSLKTFANGPIENFKSNNSYNHKPLKLNLNTIDSISLVELNGIGPVFASRIIKYRNLLGGFSNREQLKEVYGITEEVYRKIERYFEAHPNDIKKLNINTDNLLLFQKHPYIGKYKAKMIENLRKFNKGEIKLSDLQVNNIFKDEELSKIEPYIEF